MSDLTDEQIVFKLAVDGMGWLWDVTKKEWRRRIGDRWDPLPCKPFNPFTDANDMLMVIEAMAGNHGQYIIAGRCNDPSGYHKATVRNRYNKTPLLNVIAKTFQRAVCLAAIKALQASSV